MLNQLLPAQTEPLCVAVWCLYYSSRCLPPWVQSEHNPEPHCKEGGRNQTRKTSKEARDQRQEAEFNHLCGWQKEYESFGTKELETYVGMIGTPFGKVAGLVVFFFQATLQEPKKNHYRICWSKQKWYLYRRQFELGTAWKALLELKILMMALFGISVNCKSEPACVGSP